MDRYDVAFYERVLRDFEHDECVRVDEMKFGDACEKGGNFVTNVQRVSLGAMKHAVAYSISLIAKHRSTTSLARHFHFDSFFQNEIDAYRYILPALRRHSKSKLLSPECLHTSNDLIILRDLTSMGCKSFPKGHRFNIGESEIVLKELAKLHAASFALREKEPDTIDQLKKMVFEVYREGHSDAIDQGMRAQIRAAVRLFPGEQNKQIVARLNEIGETCHARLCDVFAVNREMSVFNHGDTWGNNILLQHNCAYLVDFQMMRYTSVAADLNYFLYVNLRPSERREHLDHLLASYLRHLKAFCTENDTSEATVERLTGDWLASEMKQFALFGFLSAIFILPVFHYRPDELDVDQEFDEAMTRAPNEGHDKALREYVLDYLEIS